MKLASQQYDRAWSDYMDVQAGLDLYWWQRLITFDSCRIRAKKVISKFEEIKIFTFHIMLFHLANFVSPYQSAIKASAISNVFNA